MEAQATESATGVERSNRIWIAGIGGGLVGGIGMGLIMHFVMGAMPVVGSLYGQPTVIAGWAAHLIHSVVFALIFVGLVTRTGLSRYARTTTLAAGSGVVYGAVLGVVTGAFVLPIWVNAASGAGMPVPFVSTPAFVAHLVFGLLLGSIWAVTRGTGSTTEATTGTAPETETGSEPMTSSDAEN